MAMAPVSQSSSSPLPPVLPSPAVHGEKQRSLGTLPDPSSHPDSTTAVSAPWQPELADGGSPSAPSSRGSSSTAGPQQFPAEALRHRGSRADVRARTSSTSPPTLPPHTGLEPEPSIPASTLCLLEGASGKGRAGEHGCSQHLLCPVHPCTCTLMPFSCTVCAQAGTFEDAPLPATQVWMSRDPVPAPDGRAVPGASPQPRLPCSPQAQEEPGPSTKHCSMGPAPALQQRLSEKTRLQAAPFWECNQRCRGRKRSFS